jgi:D-alanine-D-alanine ligase
MPESRLTVLLLFGGVSGEHSISIRSAATVKAALEQAGHDVITVGVSRQGRWLLADYEELLQRGTSELVEVDDDTGALVFLARTDSGTKLLSIGKTGAQDVDNAPSVDAVFPIMHGPGGEDGTLQGLLDTVGVPYVGAGCTASALAMDKLAMKAMSAGAHLPQVEFVSAGNDRPQEVEALVRRTFGFPCFVKPANLGSSVGITRVDSPDVLPDALAEARRWDERVIVERAIDAREIEVAMLGNESPEISPPGEIATSEGFYDFDTKYVANDEAGLVVPADITELQAAEIRATALRAWDLIGCRGMARADFFIEKSSGDVFFNELNTIPGFTEISMYPRLWAEAGLDLVALVNRLLELALEKHDAAAALPGATGHKLS